MRVYVHKFYYTIYRFAFLAGVEWLFVGESLSDKTEKSENQKNIEIHLKSLLHFPDCL